MLALLADPEQRAKLIAKQKWRQRFSSPDLGEYLHMDDGEFERFLDLVVRQRIEVEEASLRCQLDKTCSPRDVEQSLLDAQQREISNLFGAQTQEAFDYYRETSPIRLTIRELRVRLPDKHRLMDAQLEVTHQGATRGGPAHLQGY